MNVAIAFSPNWAYYVWIQMYSLFKSNKAPIKVYLLSDGLSDEEFEEFQKMCEYFGEGYTVKYIDALKTYSELMPSGINVDNRFSKYTLYRLLLPYFIKEDKLLYLDADTIVNGDISDFYNIDFCDNLIAGIQDIGLPKYYKISDYMKSIGLTENDIYINAGVTLMNMKAIKKLNLADKWIQMANEKLYPNHDQDILNITCKDRIKLVDLKYNVSLSTGLNIKEEDIKIMHYTGEKPWDVQNVPFCSIWEMWQKRCDAAFANYGVKECMPRVINYCWVGGKEKPELIKKCINSWKINCPDYEIVEWNEQNFDMNSHPYLKAAYDKKLYAFCNDYIRMYTLYHEGGIFLDADVLLVKSLDEFLIHRFFTGQEVNDKILVTALMASEKFHPLVKLLLNYYDNVVFDEKKLIPNTQFITSIFKLFIKEKKSDGKIILTNDSHLYTSDVFCNYNHVAHKIIESPNSYAYHLFQGSWLKK